MAVGESGAHETVLTDLVDWWEEDVADPDRRGGSYVVLVPAPRRSGRSTVLNRLCGHVRTGDGHIGVELRIAGDDAPPGRGEQIVWLEGVASRAGLDNRARQLLGVDRAEGMVELTLGIVGVAVSDLPVELGLLLASVGLTATPVVRDRTESGIADRVGRLGAAIARFSTSLPVLVVIDDADTIDPGIATTFVRSLIERIDGQVLVAAVVDLETSSLGDRLTEHAREGQLTGRVYTSSGLDSAMGELDRQRLVDEIVAGWPQAARVHLALRAQSYVDILATVTHPSAGDLIGDGADDGRQRARVDTLLADATSTSALSPTWPAIIVAWAGGIIHQSQLDATLDFLGQAGATEDPQVANVGTWVRLADPGRLNDQRLHLAAAARLDGHTPGLGRTLIDSARSITEDPGSDQLSHIAALRPLHHLADVLQLGPDDFDLLAALARNLADIGDHDDAYAVATAARRRALNAGDPTGGGPSLAALILELAIYLQNSPARTKAHQVLAQQIRTELGHGTIGLEARVWATVLRLNDPDPATRAEASTEAEALAEELDRRSGSVAARWRLLLGFHSGRAGHPSIARRMLRPLLTATDHPSARQTAEWVLLAVDSHNADRFLHLLALEHQYRVVPFDISDDERLRLVAALAETNAALSRYQHAVPYAIQELQIRQATYGSDHPDTLGARQGLAVYRGMAGDPLEACRLLAALLPDRVRALGSDHPDTLASRRALALWTGIAGDAAEARGLLVELLPDDERVLGRDDPETLRTRYFLAQFTATSGEPERALRLTAELLPDQVRVLGHDDLDTLQTRHNLAVLVGEVGHAAQALRLISDLLPDRMRVLGPDHTETLKTRSNVAQWTGKAGNPTEARRLLVELLPDAERVFGVDHPDTFTTRHNLAYWTGVAGDPAEARRLFTELLPDRVRVLGPDHPGTLKTRGNVAKWTGNAGNPTEARRLLVELLPDAERVFGVDHPDTFTTRHILAYWTGLAGDPAEARRLLVELLPDAERVFGVNHRVSLAVRRDIEG